MTGVLAARIAKLLRFHPVRMFLAILGGRVVPVFAIVALQSDDLAHRVSTLMNQAFSSNFAARQFNRQNELPSNRYQMLLSVFVINPDPDTVLTRFMNIKRKTASVQYPNPACLSALRPFRAHRRLLAAPRCLLAIPQ
jgi:hypothetical protein